MADEFDPEVDHDPNDAIEIDFDEATDTEEQPANEQTDDSEFEAVEGAEPVDEGCADVEPDSAEDEVAEGIDE